MTQKELNQQVRAWQKEDEEHRAVLAIMVETEESKNRTHCDVSIVVEGSQRVLAGSMSAVLAQNEPVRSIISLAKDEVIKPMSVEPIEDQDEEE